MEATSKQFRKRNAIYEQLCRSKAHPSAQSLYQELKSQIPDISMATVYRNLNLFRQQGLAISVGTVGGEERFDGNTAPHVHFICTNCSRVIDLEDMKLPRSLYTTASQCSGGRIDECQLSFTGLCKECLNSQKKGETA